MTQALSAWSRSTANSDSGSFKTVQDKAIAFAKENAERSFAFANDLARAKDVEDVFRLQSR